MNTKLCVRCGQHHDVSEFNTLKAAKDGLQSWCIPCRSKYNREINRSYEGLMVKIYYNQRAMSKKRHMVSPLFSLKELKAWLQDQDLYAELYQAWVDSDYKSTLKPSVDRLNDYLPYSIDNMQLMTWKENKYKHYESVKNGDHQFNNKKVTGTHLDTGEIVNYHSIKAAERALGINASSIVAVCKGKVKTAGNYTWSYTF